MIVEPIIKPTPPLARDQTDQWHKLLDVRAPAAFIHQTSQKIESDLEAVTPVARRWPRVFPGI